MKGVILIQHKILVTNLQEDVLQLEGRIKIQILGLKGLSENGDLSDFQLSRALYSAVFGSLVNFFLLSRLKLANIKESSIKPKANKDSLGWKG